MSGRSTRTEAERFWSKVKVTTPNDCWVWTANCYPNGYGQFGIDGSHKALAHRYAYESMVGPIPDGLDIMHSCDNKPCCNPAHLSPGTKSDNMQDAWDKGITAHAVASATAAYVAKMRPLIEARRKVVQQLIATGMSQQAIADRIGCSQQSVSNDVRALRQW